MRRLLLALALVLPPACGDDDAPPPPAELTATLADGATLTITTDPLVLTVTRDGAPVLVAPAFVEVGVQDGESDPDTYVDPARPDGDIRFRVATRATAYDDATRTLTLALDGAGGGKATLTVAADGTLTLATSGVPGAVLARFVLPLADDEDLYGFGMVADSPATRGVVREMQFRLDLFRESSLNELHAPVPLALYPARALGFFAAERRVGAFDVGGARADRTLITFATPSLELHVFGGPALDVLDQYTALTGRPLVPPEWAFAPMQWRNVVASGDVVLADAQRLRAEGIPGSTVWIDNPWQTGYNDFTFDARVPDPAAFIAELSALGFNCLLWSTPYVSPTGTTAADYADAEALGYLITDQNGNPFDWPWQNGPGALVDFTAPGATAWWQERVHRVTDLGFAGFKLDFGEDLVPDLGLAKNPVRLVAGGTDEWHNLYAQKYHEAYLGALPPGDGFLLTRAGTWGEQTVNTAIWPGDLDNDFSRPDAENVGGLPAAISDGLSLSASGYPFFGSDIGGFRNGAPTTEALVRWAQYAALGTIMQLGGGGDSHNPWDTTLYGPEALPIYVAYARLHMDLFPYLYTLALAAGATGHPVTRAPGLIYPGHPYEDAFLVGEGLFVAPVVVEGATTRTVTLPPGTWIDWWTGEAHAGGAAVTVPAPLDRLPLWRAADQLVVLLATPIDTLLPATAPGVVSIHDPAAARELRVLVTPVTEATLALYDGSELRATADASGVDVRAVAGSRHTDFRFELDWKNSAFSATPPTLAGALPVAADDAALAVCAAPGCWRYDAATGRALVRLVEVGTGVIVRVQ